MECCATGRQKHTIARVYGKGPRRVRRSRAGFGSGHPSLAQNRRDATLVFDSAHGHVQGDPKVLGVLFDGDICAVCECEGVMRGG